MVVSHLEDAQIEALARHEAGNTLHGTALVASLEQHLCCQKEDPVHGSPSRLSMLRSASFGVLCNTSRGMPPGHLSGCGVWAGPACHEHARGKGSASAHLDAHELGKCLTGVSMRRNLQVLQGPGRQAADTIWQAGCKELSLRAAMSDMVRIRYLRGTQLTGHQLMVSIQPEHRVSQ